MPLEIYYIDFMNAIPAAQQLNYVNLDSSDTQTANTTMSEGDLYDSDGNNVGTSEIVSFTRKGTLSTNVTSMLSLFTSSGLLTFNIVRKYDASYNPSSDVITAEALYVTGLYKSGNPVYLRLEPIGSIPNIVLKISITY